MSRLDDVCREVAATIPGMRVVPEGLQFTRRGFPARVEFRGGDTFIDVETRAAIADSLQVASAAIWHDIRNLFGFRDFQLGDREFDTTYDIVTSRREFAEQILSPQLRGVFRTFQAFYTFALRISPAGFQLRVHAIPKDAKDLDRMLVTAFQFLDAVLEAETEAGIKTTAVGITVEEDTRCKICGTDLSQGRVVRCARCSTPHHADCWTFNGKCSMFACGSTETR